MPIIIDGSDLVGRIVSNENLWGERVALFAESLSLVRRGSAGAGNFAIVIIKAVFLSCLLSYGNLLPPPAGAASAQYPAGPNLMTGLDSLSPAAREIADLTGVSPVILQLLDSQKEQSNDLSPAAISKRQKLIYLRGKVNSLVQASNLQINSTRGKVEAAIAQAEELRALITERRNRLTHRNSQINLLSGGVTKIVGYSLALSPITDIPTNVLEVFDGSVQTTLSGLALRQEKQEARLEHGMPAILDAFISETNLPRHYPEHVWHFMNNNEIGTARNKSRRQQVIESWQKSGMLAREKQLGTREKTKRNVTIELLDQRLAMLSDLKSLVSEMHNGLMELNDSIVTTYAGDPQW